LLDEFEIHPAKVALGYHPRRIALDLEEGRMFARVTTYELAEGRASESIAAFEPAIDQIRTVDGLVDAYFLVERDGLHAVSLTLWETLDAMERSRVAASTARNEAANAVGADVISTYELEVGIHAGRSAHGEALDRAGA
jgi:heme-degrading monooxygenase HmoA